MAYINGKEILFSAVVTGGGGAQVTLNAPSLEIDLYTATLTITDTLNGNFVSGYKIYINNTLIATVTDKTVLLTYYTELNETATVKVCAVGENFIDSEFATVKWTKPPLYAPTIAINNITDTLTITDTNGENVRGFAIYANGELLATVTEKTVILSNYMEFAETQEITVKALSGNDNFVDSILSNSVSWVAKIEGTAGLAYNGSICIGIGTATDTDIIIGSIHDDKEITSIQAGAFKNTNITSVMIPSGINMIHTNAFSNCTSLASVVIEKGITTIYDGTFGGCSNLSSITIPESVTYIGNVFTGCTSLRNIYITNLSVWLGIDISNTNAPFNISGGGTLYINGEPLTKLVVPDNVTEIHGILSGCTSLTSVEIPNDITVYRYAFRKCVNIASVKVNVELIGLGVFDECVNLKTVTIGKNVKKIQSGAFGDCPNITDVYYEGTAEEWASITVEDNNIINATIHYNS